VAYGFPLGLCAGVYPAHPDLTGSPSSIIKRLPSRMEGLDVLDVGTGSGVIAITAALKGAHVVACDLSIEAVNLARRNAARNDASIDIRQSDLFSGLAAQKFDIITANLWFPIKVWGFRADHRACLDMQDRFFGEVRNWLKPGGIAILASANFADNRAVIAGMARHGISAHQMTLPLRHGSGQLPMTWHSFSFDTDGQPVSL
jgi:release factor glutamine methyltransferase